MGALAIQVARESSTIDAKPLLDAIRRVRRVTPRKHTLPVLECVRLVAHGELVTITGTDLATTVSVDVPGATTDAWSACVPLRALADACKGAKGAVAFDVGASTITVRANGASRTLAAFPADEFPTDERDAHYATDRVAGDALAALVNRTAYAMSVDGTRPHLNALYLVREGATLRAVTTDGHRMALAECTTGPRAAGTDWTALVPFDAVATLADFKGSVSIRIANDRAWFESPTARVCTKLVDAAFPAYGQVIPADGAPTLRVSRTELRDAIRSVMLGPKGGFNLICRDGQACELSTDNRETTASATCHASWSGKDGFKVGFECRYITEMLDARGPDKHGTDVVHLQLSGELDPLLVRFADGCAVVMPMRI